MVNGSVSLAGRNGLSGALQREGKRGQICKSRRDARRLRNCPASRGRARREATSPGEGPASAARVHRAPSGAASRRHSRKLGQSQHTSEPAGRGAHPCAGARSPPPRLRPSRPRPRSPAGGRRARRARWRRGGVNGGRKPSREPPPCEARQPRSPQPTQRPLRRAASLAGPGALYRPGPLAAAARPPAPPRPPRAPPPRSGCRARRTLAAARGRPPPAEDGLAAGWTPAGSLGGPQVPASATPGARLAGPWPPPRTWLPRRPPRSRPPAPRCWCAGRGSASGPGRPTVLCLLRGPEAPPGPAAAVPMPAAASREHRWRAWPCSPPPAVASSSPSPPRGLPAFGAGSRPPGGPATTRACSRREGRAGCPCSDLAPQRPKEGASARN